MASVASERPALRVPSDVNREDFDLPAYQRMVRNGPCFVCAIAANIDGYRAVHQMIYEDDFCLVFLNRFPTLYGATLVCPREHREDLTNDFTEAEHLDLQTVIYRVARAVRLAVPCERMYVLSLGSQQGNRHVHWHITPLPPGVPLDQQQIAALDCRRGVLRVSDTELARLARDIRRHLLSAPRTAAHHSRTTTDPVVTGSRGSQAARQGVRWPS